MCDGLVCTFITQPILPDVMIYNVLLAVMIIVHCSGKGNVAWPGMG